MKHNFEKRLQDLEQNKGESIDIKLYWSEDEIPPEHRDSVIRLKWPEEL
jgi:hypothetical protein